MGISRANGALALVHDAIRLGRLVVTGLRMAELGNQSLRKDVLGIQVPAKKFFTAMGMEHTSIDQNGKDGALPLDLCLPITRPDLLESFDLVTNFGTIEHVDRQYPAWRNVHSLAKVGGLFLHLLPETGSWPGHCPYRYGPEFPAALARCCAYEVLQCSRGEINPDHRFSTAILRKTKSDFPAEEVFSSPVTIDSPLAGKRARP